MITTASLLPVAGSYDDLEYSAFHEAGHCVFTCYSKNRIVDSAYISRVKDCRLTARLKPEAKSPEMNLEGGLIALAGMAAGSRYLREKALATPGDHCERLREDERNYQEHMRGLSTPELDAKMSALAAEFCERQDVWEYVTELAEFLMQFVEKEVHFLLIKSILPDLQYGGGLPMPSIRQ
jgi:hypothetical protein